jgi:hypothetical protein
VSSVGTLLFSPLTFSFLFFPIWPMFLSPFLLVCGSPLNRPLP